MKKYLVEGLSDLNLKFTFAQIKPNCKRMSANPNAQTIFCPLIASRACGGQGAFT